MGNAGSSGNHGRRRTSHPIEPSPQVPAPIQQHPQPAQVPEIAGNRYVFSAAPPYTLQYPNPNAPPPPPPPPPPPASFDQRRGGGGPHHLPNWGGGGGGRYPCGPPPLPAPYVKYQKGATIRNDVNIKKETLGVEADEANPGRFLVAFTFDATVAGSITVYFFAKEEGFNCNLTATKGNLLESITVSFKEGLGQKFRQPSGTGIDFSMFEELELLKEGEMEVYPLAVKAEASPIDEQRPVGENQNVYSLNSQITQAVFEKKENGEYRVQVVKQILWGNGIRYELQDIYGIGNSVHSVFDRNDPGKECVICLSEPWDTTVLPCRHMCMCNGCAKVLRYKINGCPICRQPVERLFVLKE